MSQSLIVHFTLSQLAALVAITAAAATEPALRASYGVTADEAIGLAATFAAAQPGFVHIPPTCADLLVGELDKLKAACTDDPEQVRLLANASARIDAARGQ